MFMGIRGPKPKGKVKIKWTSNFAYAIGLIVSDGSLSVSGRHVSFASKDIEQLENFCRALKVNHLKIGKNRNKYGVTYRVQISDTVFYNFLISIGLMTNKSKVIGKIKIPKKYFSDFVRGVFDGDGTSYSYFDKRWRSSYMFYVSFASGSKKFIDWFRSELKSVSGINGHITVVKVKNSCHQLKYAKTEAVTLVRYMYSNIQKKTYLKRKYLKIMKSLDIIDSVRKRYGY